jgi:lipooligosaccharide transport system permease protein
MSSWRSPAAPLTSNEAAVRGVLAELGYWLLRYRRTWRGTVVISIVNPALFLAALGAGLGPLVDRHQSSYLHGVAYVAFLAPGLLAAAMMQTAFVESAGPVAFAARSGGAYRAALATPVEPGELYLGHLLFIAFRLGTSGAAFAFVAWCFGAVPGARLPAVVGAALLTGLAFAAPLAAWAVSVQRTALLTGLFRFLVMPLYMFSGTFFSPSQLPAWLHSIVSVTPLYHGVQLCRSLSLGTATAGATIEHVGYLSSLTVLGIAAGCVSYRQALAS